MSLYTSQLDYDNFNKSFTKWSVTTLSGVRRAIADMTVEAAELGASITADIINDETNGTGRAAASIGRYDSGRLKHPSSESGPQDAFWSTRWIKDEFEVVYGSHVPYLPYIDLGFDVETQRVIFLQGRFVTVGPFSFQGIHAFDRAIVQVQGDRAFMQRLFSKHFARIGFS